jgi:DNA-binding response OmpR family regulator
MPDPVLLLSKDEQAVHVVSQVLAELSFAVERPADATSAVSEIEKRAFSAILVDCDDAASGKAIFDAARHSNGNKQTPAIAIVSGRTGLPTAFRLGAGFVVTKPASLDQARHALRAATSRIKKNIVAPQETTAVASTPVLAKAAAATSAASGDGKTQTTAPKAARRLRSFLQVRRLQLRLSSKRPKSPSPKLQQSKHGQPSLAK